MDGSDDPKKGTQLLEVYALEIQMHSEQVAPLPDLTCPRPRPGLGEACGALAQLYLGFVRTLGPASRRLTRHVLQRNAKALKGLYHKALSVKSAIPHPRILGVIRECGGKMHMHQRTWEEAATDFFEVRGLPSHSAAVGQRAAAAQTPERVIQSAQPCMVSKPTA